jgi:hypothetical protein
MRGISKFISCLWISYECESIPRSAVTESPLERRLCLRTPGTAITVVNDKKIPPEGGTPNAFTVKLTQDCNDIVFLHVCGLCASCVKKINAKDAIVATVQKRLNPGGAG